MNRSNSKSSSDAPRTESSFWWWTGKGVSRKWEMDFESRLERYYWPIRSAHEWGLAIPSLVLAPISILRDENQMESYLSWLFELVGVAQYIPDAFLFIFAIFVIWLVSLYIWGNPMKRRRLVESLTLERVIRAYVAFFWAIVASVAVFFYQEYSLWVGVSLPLLGLVMLVYLWIRAYIFGNDRIPDALGRPIW